jgi:hypothetical protein
LLFLTFRIVHVFTAFTQALTGGLRSFGPYGQRPINRISPHFRHFDTSALQGVRRDRTLSASTLGAPGPEAARSVRFGGSGSGADSPRCMGRSVDS